MDYSRKSNLSIEVFNIKTISQINFYFGNIVLWITDVDSSEVLRLGVVAARLPRYLAAFR